MMQLSQCTAVFSEQGAQVHRDGAFGSLGFLAHHREAMLTFLSDEAYLAALEAHTDLAAVITTRELAPRVPASLAVVISEAPRRTFFALHHRLATATAFYGADDATRVAPSAEIHPTVHVPSQGVHIGERVRLEPYVVLLGRVVLEEDVIVRAGTVVGGEGFQVEREGDALHRVVHAGGVHLARGVEVLANSTIARALFGGATRVGEDTVVDSRVFIAHDAQLGRRNRVVAGAVICGSVITGDDVWVGPGAVISHAVRVGNGGRISIGAVANRDVAEGQTVTGNLAVDHARHLEFLRSLR